MYVGKYLLFDDNKRPASMCKEKRVSFSVSMGENCIFKGYIMYMLCHSMLELIVVTINHAAMCGIKVCTSVHTVLSNSTEKNINELIRLISYTSNSTYCPLSGTYLKYTKQIMGVVYFTLCTPVHNLKSQAPDTDREIQAISLHCIGIVKRMYELTTHFSFAVH